MIYDIEKINNYQLLDDKIIFYYKSGVKKIVKDKTALLYAHKRLKGKITEDFIYALNTYTEDLKEYKKNKYTLTYKKLWNILKKHNNSYYDTYRAIVNGKVGYSYRLDKPMDATIFKNFTNVKIGTSRCVQAPELESTLIWIQGEKNNYWWY